MANVTTKHAVRKQVSSYVGLHIAKRDGLKIKFLTRPLRDAPLRDAPG